MYFNTIIKAVVLTSLLGMLYAQRDLTIAVGANGTEVVMATVSRIQQSGIFPDDNRFLRRVAFAESRDGLDSDTFRDGYFGGIWQVDEAIFLVTLNVTAHPELARSGGIFDGISNSFNVEWRAVTWQDLRRPLFSALAARIFFELAEGNIPDIGDVRGQGRYWKDTGFNTNPGDTVDFFVQTINTLELEECPNRGIDLAFILDSSGSVGQRNFDLEKQLVSDIVDRFSIGSNATQVAVISYSGFARINFRLDNFTTRQAVQQAVDAVEYFDIAVDTGTGRRTSTNTADGLIRLRREVFVPEAGARSADVAIPRVAVVITDGQSNVNASLTIPSALALREDKVTVYSVGVGNRINMNELRAIASSPENVRLLSGFDPTEFDGLRSRITADACIATVFVDIERTLNIELEGGDITFFEFELPLGGMTISLLRQEGRANLFASNKLRNPNSAFYDYRIDNEGEVFVDLEDLVTGREKRQALAVRNRTLYVSLEGIERLSSYKITTSFGNTISSSATGIHYYATSCALLLHPALLLLSHLL